MQTAKTDLTLTCFRISNGALAAKELPGRIKILNWGDNPSVKGNVRVGLKTLSTLPGLQQARGFDKVALDYEHNTVEGTTAYKASSEPRKVAAYSPVEVIKDDGLYLKLLEYTPSGKENAREFIDLSPAVAQDKDGEVLFVHSVALCRQGAVEDLNFYSVSIPTKTETEPMTATEFATALESFKTELAGIKSTLAGLTTLSADVTDLKSKIGNVQALETKLTTLSNDWKTSLADQLKAADKAARADIQTAAAQAGKVIPLSADQIEATPVATLKDMVAKLPVTVPLHQRTPVKIVEHSAATEVDATLAAQIGARAREIQSTEKISNYNAFARAEKELRKQ